MDPGALRAVHPYFCDWLEAKGRPATLDELTRPALSAWLADLADRVDIETVRTRLRGMRRFCRWLAAEGEVDRAPTDGVEMPAPSEKPVRVLTDDELGRLLKPQCCRSTRARPRSNGPTTRTGGWGSATACNCRGVVLASFHRPVRTGN
jgi:site-specific recombinase XerD